MKFLKNGKKYKIPKYMYEGIEKQIDYSIRDHLLKEDEKITQKEFEKRIYKEIVCGFKLQVEHYEKIIDNQQSLLLDLKEKGVEF